MDPTSRRAPSERSGSNGDAGLAVPTFTIVTPTFEGLDDLRQTLESTLAQDYAAFEHLVVDGGSGDRTTGWLAGLTDRRVRWWSEPDRGLYDAMNKGIDRARGRYLLFLGAGDILNAGVLSRVAGRLPSDERGIVYGDVLWKGSRFDGRYSRLKLCHHNICQQAIFYGRDAFDLVGRFDLRYPILADWALNIACFGDRRIRHQYVPITIARYKDGGISRIGDGTFEAEKASLLRDSFGRVTCLIHRVDFRYARRTLKVRQAPGWLAARIAHRAGALRRRSQDRRP
jgi:glycosyltransferase involved in cell wall biosynthesis